MRKQETCEALGDRAFSFGNVKIDIGTVDSFQGLIKCERKSGVSRRHAANKRGYN